MSKRPPTTALSELDLDQAEVEAAARLAAWRAHQARPVPPGSWRDRFPKQTAGASEVVAPAHLVAEPKGKP